MADNEPIFDDIIAYKAARELIGYCKNNFIKDFHPTEEYAFSQGLEQGIMFAMNQLMKRGMLKFAPLKELK